MTVNQLVVGSIPTAGAKKPGGDPLIETVAERPAVAQRVAGAYRELAIRGAARPERKGRVSPRQLEILRLVAKGMSNDEIAQRLVLSPATAKTHVSRIMTKLGVRDRAQLVVLAYESALVTPGWMA